MPAGALRAPLVDRARLRWVAAIFGAVAAPVVTAALAATVMFLTWVARCYDHATGRCEDVGRLVKWSVLHGALVGAHAIVVGGVVAFVVAFAEPRLRTRWRAAVAGAAVGLPLGTLASAELWFAMGTEVPLFAGVVSHGLVGALLGLAVYEAFRRLA